jgi:outer membrane PBP1 activator LpoA protein
VLLLGALACAAAEGPPQTTPSASELAYRRAVAVIESDPDGAEPRLEVFLREWPKSARFDDAALELARLKAARGDGVAARDVLLLAIRRQPRGDRVDSARLLLARIEREAGRLDEAYRVASAIRPTHLPPAERAEAYRLLAEVAGSREDRTGQLRWLGQLASESKSAVEREAAAREIDSVLAALETTELERVAGRLGEKPPAVALWLRLAQRELAAGDLDAAERALEAARQGARGAEMEEIREQLAARLRARRGIGPELGLLPEFAEVARLEEPPTEGAAGTLGVVLPLSGSFARFGEASLRGVMLAAGIFEADGARAGVRLAVRDSRGNPHVAAAAVAVLAADPDVRAIVGPLLSEESEAAAATAEREGVPLLALTPREGVAAKREHVFRLALTPRAEVEALADHAVQVLGVQRVAILHPRDAYGRGLKNLFWDSIEARGATVAGVASYEPDATDFADPIRRLVGYLLLRDGEK